MHPPGVRRMGKGVAGGQNRLIAFGMSISPRSFARVYGSPGTNARVAGALRVMTPVVTLLAVTGVCLGLALPVPRIPAPYNAFLLVICAAGIVATGRLTAQVAQPCVASGFGGASCSCCRAVALSGAITHQRA